VLVVAAVLDPPEQLEAHGLAGEFTQAQRVLAEPVAPPT
jgi:hypothetical protein